MKKYLDIALQAAAKAGKLQMASLYKPKKISNKGIIDYVTDIDIACEKLICGIIAKSYPAHSFLAEEKTCVPGPANADSSYRWIIDPIDGTVNYMHQLPLFCVSIGLEIDHKLQVGVVYAPALNECFTAIRGKGAFLNNKRIYVSDRKDLNTSLMVTGFAYDIRRADNTNLENFARVSLNTLAVRRFGSAAIDLSYVACGRFDGFWELHLNPWDTAAGALLVQEAGGTVTDFKGKPFDIFDKQILATNSNIHSALQKLIK